MFRASIIFNNRTPFMYYRAYTMAMYLEAALHLTCSLFGETTAYPIRLQSILKKKGGYNLHIWREKKKHQHHFIIIHTV